MPQSQVKNILQNDLERGIFSEIFIYQTRHILINGSPVERKREDTL